MSRHVAGKEASSKQQQVQVLLRPTGELFCLTQFQNQFQNQNQNQFPELDPGPPPEPSPLPGARGGGGGGGAAARLPGWAACTPVVPVALQLTGKALRVFRSCYAASEARAGGYRAAPRRPSGCTTLMNQRRD